MGGGQRLNALRWQGGKANHLKKIIPLFPEHKTYIEPFCGGCSVLLNKPKSYAETINDLNGDLVNFWRMVKERPDELIRSFDYVFASRQTFDEYKARYKAHEYDSDIQRAHIFYYINRTTFGGKMDSVTFGVSPQRRNSFVPSNIRKTIEACYERIRDVCIEHLPYNEVMRRYDFGNALFFLDPPYRNSTGYRTGAFPDEEYVRLAELCRSMKGKFLLTINDDDFIRGQFQGFNIIDRDVTYSLNCNRQGEKSKELIITNYDV